MRHSGAALLILATLWGCGSEGPTAPPDATASFSVSARVIPVRCELPNCPAAGSLPIAIPVRVMESGGVIGGYVTRMDLVMRDASTGAVLGSRRYDAAEIGTMTFYGSNEVFPNAWLEVVTHPFRQGLGDGEGRARTVSIALTITDYRGHEHQRTVDVSV